MDTEGSSFFGAGEGIELFTSEGFFRPPMRDVVEAVDAVDGRFSVAGFPEAPETLALAPPKAVGLFNPLLAG